MSVTQQVHGDIDGDGQVETISFFSDCSTVVYRGNQAIWRSPNWIDGWNRRPWDQALAAQLVGDGRSRIFVANNRDNWTGVLQWTGGALHVEYAAPSPLHGPAGDWNRRSNDQFYVVPFDGHEGIAVHHPGPDEWFGTLTWLGSSLGPVSIRKSATGSLSVVMTPTPGGNPDQVFIQVDDALVTPGATVMTVENRTRGSDGQDPYTVALQLSHPSWDSRVADLGDAFAPGDTTSVFTGAPVTGLWQANLIGTAIVAQGQIQIAWRV